jgi:hypothetical protein
MKIIRGTIVGGIAFFLLGWLFFGILFMDFFSSGMNQCASKPGGEMTWWALIASNLITALFLTLFLKWSGAKNIKDGFITGAIFGFLYAAAIDLSFWSMTTMYTNIKFLLADIAINTLLLTIVAIIIVLLWGKEKKGTA